ncbi:MAG: ATP-binding protein [Pseudomonadota bacterium]
MTNTATVQMPRDAQVPRSEADTSKNPRQISLTISADPNDIRVCLTDLKVEFASAKLATDLVINTELVLAELLNNIAEHSFSGRSGGVIKLQIALSCNAVRLVLEDNGRPMPNLSLPDPDRPELDVALENLPEGGFGWFMIRRLTSELSYSRIGQRNQLIAVIPLP